MANAHEWSARSLESFLAPNGFAVLRAYTATSALERARIVPLDAVILDAELPGMGALALCRALRADPYIPASLPIVLVASGPPARLQRRQALHAGASDFWTQPLDAEEVLLQLEARLRAKRDADRSREEGLIDPMTGLYNARGFSHRARDLRSQAARQHTPLACVAFAPNPDPTATRTVIEVLARALHESGRASDAIGRLAAMEFAVLAPHTDAAGAIQLGTRLVQAMERAAERRRTLHRPLSVRAGYHAVSEVNVASANPTDLVASARAALRAARADANEGWIRAFANS